MRENNILARKYYEEIYWNWAENDISEIEIIVTEIASNGKSSVGGIRCRREMLGIGY